MPVHILVFAFCARDKMDLAVSPSRNDTLTASKHLRHGTLVVASMRGFQVLATGGGPHECAQEVEDGLW